LKRYPRIGRSRGERGSAGRNRSGGVYLVLSNPGDSGGTRGVKRRRRKTIAFADGWVGRCFETD
jgi:hypothetical protein